MTSRAEIASGEAHALALRMAKHFAHKVRVETDAGRTRVHTRFGPFELEPAEKILHVRATADDEEALARLEDVVVAHLGRFARGEELDVSWKRDG